MKKTIIATTLALSSLFAFAGDKWKVEIELAPDVKATMIVDADSAAVIKSGKLWLVNISIDDGKSVADFVSVTSGCDSNQGRVMLFDSNEQPVGSKTPIPWKIDEQDLSSTIAKFTCVAAHRKGLVKTVAI